MEMSKKVNNFISQSIISCKLIVYLKFDPYNWLWKVLEIYQKEAQESLEIISSNRM